jgi:hypothetical protein
MEAMRKELGLEGILFRFYRCSECGTDDIFLDLYPLADESDDDFRARRQELETAVRGVHAESAEVVLVERHPGDRA